jgi:hypothetical protein
LAQRADLLAFDQLVDGPPKPLAQGVVGKQLNPKLALIGFYRTP